MMFTSRKPERVEYPALYFLVALMFVLTGCSPETETPIDADQTFIEGFTKGTPDPNTSFPESEFAQAKQLRTEKKLYTAEKLMIDKIDQAKASGVGQTQLGRYLMRLQCILHDEFKDVESIKYGEIALKIFYAQPMEKRPIAANFCTVHTYLALSYERQRRYAEAEKHFLKALSLASSAPRAEIPDPWVNMLYSRLAATYRAQKKTEQAQKVLEALKNLKRG